MNSSLYKNYCAHPVPARVSPFGLIPTLYLNLDFFSTLQIRALADEEKLHDTEVRFR